jgi:hypothetical protein
LQVARYSYSYLAIFGASVILHSMLGSCCAHVVPAAFGLGGDIQTAAQDPTEVGLLVEPWPVEVTLPTDGVRRRAWCVYCTLVDTTIAGRGPQPTAARGRGLWPDGEGKVPIGGGALHAWIYTWVG